jgi:hypothetical protein
MWWKEEDWLAGSEKSKASLALGVAPPGIRMSGHYLIGKISS